VLVEYLSKKKIMDRVKIATQEEIQEYIDADELAAEFGGNLEVTTLNYIEFIRDAVGVKRNEQKRLRRKGEKVNVKKSTKKSKNLDISSEKSKSEVTVTEETSIMNESEDPGGAISSDSQKDGNLDDYLSSHPTGDNEDDS